MTSGIKKFLLSAGLILAFVVYIFIRQDEETAGTLVIQPTIPTTPIGMGMMSAYKDGEYIGSIADAYYGNLQVKAIIQNGRIFDVKFLQYPNDRRNSIRINTIAMPYLKSEAIQAQSAKVDIVSGATQTSGAFRESLAFALAQAKN